MLGDWSLERIGRSIGKEGTTQMMAGGWGKCTVGSKKQEEGCGYFSHLKKSPGGHHISLAIKILKELSLLTASNFFPVLF